jgi:hypothetical protein
VGSVRPEEVREKEPESILYADDPPTHLHTAVWPKRPREGDPFEGRGGSSF